MLLQFNSVHPMLGGDYLCVFTHDYRKIPEWIRSLYELRAVGLSVLENLPDVNAEVTANNFTYGIEVPVDLTRKRLGLTYLRYMVD